MFNKNKKLKNEEAVNLDENKLDEQLKSGGNNQLAKQTKLGPLVLKNARIHIMPDKFLKHLPRVKVKKSGKGLVSGQKKAKMSGMKKSVLIGAIIGLVFVIVIAAAAWMFIRSISEQPDQGTDAVTLPPVLESEVEEDEEIKEEQEMCGQDNCEACDADQCKLLADFCRFEIVFEACPDDDTEECAVQKCQPGKAKTEVKKEEIEKEEEIVLTKLPESQDLDRDGLTDVEEKIWGSELRDSDSDGDGYLDGQEIYNFYNPQAGDSTRLSKDGLVKNFISRDLGYSFYYPAEFDLIQSRNTDRDVMVKSLATQEFFNLLILDNETSLKSVNDWYLVQNPYARRNELLNITVGDKIGVATENGLSVYVLVDDKVYLISYQPGTRDELNFRTTFGMFLKSFEFFSNPF